MVGRALHKELTRVTTQPVSDADGMRVAQGEASAASETLGSVRQIFMWVASTNPGPGYVHQKGKSFRDCLNGFSLSRVGPTGFEPAASQGFARCARFTLGYSHAVGFADWLNGFIVEVSSCTNLRTGKAPALPVLALEWKRVRALGGEQRSRQWS